MSSKILRHITVDEGNYLSLKRLGSAGDSFNDVISKLLKTAIFTTEKEIEKERLLARSTVNSPERQAVSTVLSPNDNPDRRSRDAAR